MAETLIPIEEVTDGASSNLNLKAFEALLKNSGRTKANASFTTPVTNGISEITKLDKHYPLEIEGPKEIDANTEAVYKLTKYQKSKKESTPKDAEKNTMKWAFYIDGVVIKDNIIDHIKFANKEKEKINTESLTDFMTIEDPKKRTDAIIKNAFLYKKGEIKDGTVTLTLKFSKWLDGHTVHIEAYRGKPENNTANKYLAQTKVKAQPEVINIQWVNKKELPITFSNYTQEKYLKIHALGLKNQDIEVLVEDGTEKQRISFSGKHTAQSIKIEDRYTLKKVNVYANKDKIDNAPATEVLYKIQDPKTLSNDVELPELKLRASVTQGKLINKEDNLVFAKHLAVYPTEKIVSTYFATPKKVNAKKEDGTTEKTTIYEKIDQLSIGQKTYLVADCINLADKTIKLKIHEKAGTDGKLKIQTSEDDYFKVCKPKKDSDKTYTELPKNDWLEGTVDKDTNQAVIELQMRPKTDKMASDTEEAKLSLEGWKEALYHREDETETGKKTVKSTKDQVAARAKELFINLIKDTDAHEEKNKKSFPKSISGPKTIEIAKEAVYTIETYAAGATKADKNNIQWCLYKQDDPKINYTIINTKSRTGLYTYAKMELIGDKNQLTIVFDKALKGKKIQIEPFRGRPDINTTKDYVRTTTVEEQEKAKLVKKLTTNLFVSAECCEAEDGDISYANKEVITKLQHGGLLFPFHKLPQNHPDNFKTEKYKAYDYYLPDNKGKASTFGYPRNPGSRIHAARDLYTDVGEPIYAIADGKVLAVENFYMKTDVIVVEHEYETKLAKGFKMIVRYGEVDKNTIKVKVGSKVFRGDKIAEVGQLINKNGTNFQQPSGENRGMLHIEMYTGEVSATLKPGWVDYSKMKHAKSSFNKNRSFKRRIDLFDPLDLLKEMLANSKKENLIE